MYGLLLTYFIYLLFLVALALRCFTWAFSSCGEQGLLSGCGAWTSDGGVFSYGGAQALGAWGLVSAARGLSSCGLWALGCVGFSSAVLGLSSHSSWALELGPSSVVHELSCAVTSGIFSDQGSNLCPLHWQVDSYPLCHQGSLITSLNSVIHLEFLWV